MSTPARLGAALVLSPMVLLLASGPALAADGVNISNSETVQAHLTADGSVVDARVYEQVAMQGVGTVDIKNPVSTNNLRNLDGFRGFEVTDGNIFTRASVDGERRMRTVSDYGKTLPLKVDVTYKLNGKSVKAGDVVGKSGRLEVHYKVENVTGKDQELTYDDGTGTMVTETQKVVIPMVGTLTTVLPSNFTDVASAEANMAGDGRGQTQMSYTMTLFGPLGSPTSEFGYSATIAGGLIPEASISALPINPLTAAPFKGGSASYKAGGTSGVTLTAGAIEIDANVLKLRDGAATLISGLIQLRDGAQELNVGLAGDAAPGAIKLAAGATQLDSGAGELSSAFKSPSGGQDLTSGSAALASGVAQISAGLQELSGIQGLPKALAGLQELRAGLDHPVGATGAKDPGGLLQGLQQIAGGLSNPACDPAKPSNPANPCGVKQGLASVKLGVSNPACSIANPTNPANPCGIKEIVNYVGRKLTDASADTTGDIVKTTGDIVKLGSAVIGAYQQSTYVDPVTLVVKACPTSTSKDIPVPPVVPPTALEGKGIGLPSLEAMGLPSTGVCFLLSSAAYGLKIPSGYPSPSDLDGLGGLKVQTAAAGAALGMTGSGIDGQLLPGLALLKTGVDTLAAGSVSARDAVSTQVLPGVDALVVGITDALTGSQKLAAGALTATSGSGDLASGILQAGAGAGKLKAGTGELDAGARKLATGLGDAATGSAQLSAGLITAADSGKALPEGATKLSVEGTSKLVESGKSTASDYGLKYAVLVAGAERAKTENMAYGAPLDAAGTTAYAMVILGADNAVGTSLGHGGGALALFGAGVGLILYRRRLV